MANAFDQFDAANAFDQFDQHEHEDRKAGVKAAAIRNQLSGALSGEAVGAITKVQDESKTDNVFDKFDADAISDPFFHFLKSTALRSGSTLLDLLHQLGRPGSAIMASIKQARDENQRLLYPKIDQERAEGGGKIGVAGFPVDRSILEAAGRGLKEGFSYEDETRAKDLMNQEFVSNHPIQSSVLGFILDVIADPLTFGAAKAVTLPIEFGAKGLVKLGGKSETLTNIAERMSASQIANAFNIHIGEAKKIKEMSDNFRDRLKGSHQQAEEFIKMRQIQMSKIAEDAGITVDDLNRAILNDIETGALGTVDSATAKFGDDAVRVAKEDKAMYDELLRLEQEAGVKISDVLERAGDLGIEGYIPHIVTQAARRKMAGPAAFIKRQSTPLSTTHVLKRKQPGTIDEINERMLEKMKGGQFMHNDAALLRGIRTSRHAQEMAYINFNNAARDLAGKTADDFPKGAVPSNWKALDDIVGPNGEKIYFPEHLSTVIKRQRDILRNTTTLDKYVKWFDAVQNPWKMWTLAIRPSYHMRNVAGNLWNAYTVAGVKNPKVFMDAARMQMSALYRNDPKMAAQVGPFNWWAEVKIKGGGTKTYREIYDEAVNRGILGKGQYGVGSDIQMNLERQLERTAGVNQKTLHDFITPTGENVLLQKGFQVGNMMEDNARLATFLDVFKRTGSFDEAAQMTKRALFDYSDLSAFERTVMKRLFPFYTWTRKNIPAQVKALWSNPERARKLDIARQQAEYEEGRPDPQNIYEFYNKGVPIYLGKEERDEVWKMYRMLNYLPIADLERTTDMEKMVTEMLSPILKHPYEQIKNYDLFRQKQIEQYTGETTDFLGIRMPVRMAHFAQLLVHIAEFNRSNPWGMFGEATKDEETGEWTRTKSWGLEQPLVGFEIPDWLPGSGKYEFGGVERESTRDQPRAVRLLQYTLGLRPYYVGEASGRQYAIKAFNKDKNSLKYYLNKAIKDGKSRRAEELKVLLEQWEAAEEAAKLQAQALKEGRSDREPDRSFRGSRYYE